MTFKTKPLTFTFDGSYLLIAGLFVGAIIADSLIPRCSTTIIYTMCGMPFFLLVCKGLAHMYKTGFFDL